MIARVTCKKGNRWYARKVQLLSSSSLEPKIKLSMLLACKLQTNVVSGMYHAASSDLRLLEELWVIVLETALFVDG